MARKQPVVSIAERRPVQTVSVADAILAHLDGLYRFALRLTRDPGQARDLTQETALSAWKRQNTVLRNPRGWLFQILYNTFLTNHRRQLHREAEWTDAEDGSGAAEFFQNRLRDLIAAEDVRLAVAALPEELRTVVWLSDAEEFRLREIAEILGVSSSTVAESLRRGIRKLRKCSGV